MPSLPSCIARYCTLGLIPERPAAGRKEKNSPALIQRGNREVLAPTSKVDFRQGANILGILDALIGACGGYPMRASSDRRGIWIGSLPAMASIERVTSEPSLLADLPHTATTSALAAGIHPVGSRIIGYRKHHAPLGRAIPESGPSWLPASGRFARDCISPPTHWSWQITDAIRTLPPRYREVVTRYHFAGWTMKQIGAQLGVNESRVIDPWTLKQATGPSFPRRPE